MNLFSVPRCALALLFSGSSLLWAEGDNLLQDSCFDEGVALNESSIVTEGGGWFIRPGTAEMPAEEAALDEAEGATSPSSLRLKNKAPESFTGVTQLVSVEPHTEYVLRGKVKATSLEALSQEAAGARICISEALPPSNSIFASPTATPDSDWHEVTVRFNSGDRLQIKVLLYLHKTAGTVWFDDLELIKL